MSSDTVEPKGSLWLLIIAVLVIMSAAVFYFGQNKEMLSVTPLPTSTEISRPARTYTVFYSDGVFSPTNIRIHAGDTVRFDNNSANSVYVLSDDVGGKPLLIGFDSSTSIPPGGFFSFIFNRPGTFGYHNDLKESETGTVIVRP